MNRKRKFLAIALSCVMLAGTTVTTAIVPGSETPFGITVSAAGITESGSCGENVSYTLDSDGTLTISGTGAMEDYYYADSPFWDNYDIKKVIIEDGVTRIGDYTFPDCGSLKSVTVPDGVTSIGERAFRKCTSLRRITIPDSVISIGDQALGYYYDNDSIGDKIMTDFMIRGSKGSEAERYAKDNGLKFIPAGETLIIDSGSCGENVNYTLDSDGTLTISGTGAMNNYGYGSSPFYESPYIDKVIIKDGVTSIGTGVFIGCKSLESVTVPDGVTSIGDDAFSDCTSLKNIIIPDGVTSIGDDAFSDCTSLKNIIIPDSVMNIGYGAFRCCESLGDITIPDNLTNIGLYAFDETSWYDDQPDGVVYLGKIVYKYKGDMPEDTDITLKDGTIGIAGDAFWNCNTLKSIKLPDSLTSIGLGAFDGCTSLTSIKIPDGVTSIGLGAFSYCLSLEDITIPNGVTSIESDTFFHCSSLESIIIPDSVTKIGEDAFNECYELRSITIPDSVTSIGGDAFEFTPWYDDLPDGMLYIGKVAYKYKGDMSDEDTDIIIKDGTTEIAGRAFEFTTLTSITIPDSVTSIGNYAFWDCTSLTSITIPDSVTNIGDYAFSSCSALTDITIPDSVTSIGDWAFSGCSALESITIPDSVTSIGSGAFSFCASLAEIKVDDNNTAYSSQDGILFDKKKEKLICCPGGNTRAEYTIPDSVTQIENYAFDRCASLTNVTIPDSVTFIGGAAFCGCTSLMSITIPDSVKYIDERALGYFYNEGNDFEKLPGFTITGYSGTAAERYAKDNGFEFISLGQPDITESGKCGDNVTYNLDNEGTLTISGSGAMDDYIWGGSPLFKNSGIKEIVIEDGVTSIGNNAFNGCSSLRSITIPDSVMSFGDGAFCNCTSLTSIDVPDGVTTIGNGTFAFCFSLMSINIPDGVKSIGARAFDSCTSLTDITIPDSVTSIEDFALGYSYDGQSFNKQPDFTIIGYTGSEAERYANDNGFRFIALGDELTPGDVTGDGNADIADALFVARADAGLATLTDAQKQAADVNGDGNADIADALFIARVDAGLAKL